VILSWATPGGGSTEYVTGSTWNGFRAMPGFRMLSCDRFLCGPAVMIGVQTTAAAINPTQYHFPSATESMNLLAIALKTDVSKGSQATGIRIVSEYHTRITNGTFIPTSFPTRGNLTVLVASTTFNQNPISAIKDTANAGTAWTRLSADGYPQFGYFANSTADQTNFVSASASGGAGLIHGVLWDIMGAATAPYDTDTTAGGTVSGPVLIPNAPDITPSTSNGLVVASLNLLQGPPQYADLPSGVVFHCMYHDAMTDLSTMDSGDGYAHYLNPNTSTVSIRWYDTSVIPSSGWTAHAVAFKAPAAATSLPKRPTIINQAVKRAATY
jgi:hypothetical protein